MRCTFVLCDLVRAVAILSAAFAAQDIEDCTSFSERSSPPNEVFGLYCVCILVHYFQPDFGYFPSSKVRLLCVHCGTLCFGSVRLVSAVLLFPLVLEFKVSVALRPQRPYIFIRTIWGSQDSHLDRHTAPEL